VTYNSQLLHNLSQELNHASDAIQLTALNSTSKNRVLFGGIGPAFCDPYLLTRDTQAHFNNLHYITHTEQISYLHYGDELSNVIFN